MSSAAQLGNLLNVTADLNYYTMQLNFWSQKYEANSQKLNEQVKYEEKWEAAFDDAMEGSKECKVGNTVYVKKDQGTVSEKVADAYAHAKVRQYDEELSLELASLDIEYDTMKTMYEALVTQLTAEKDADKQSTGTSLQDTHLLNQ